MFLCLVLHLPEWRLIVDADLNPTLKFEVLQRTQKILSLTRKKNSFYLRYRLPSRDPALVRSTIFPEKLRKVYHVWYQNFKRKFSFLKLLVFLSVTARLRGRFRAKIWKVWIKFFLISRGLTFLRSLRCLIYSTNLLYPGVRSLYMFPSMLA